MMHQFNKKFLLISVEDCTQYTELKLIEKFGGIYIYFLDRHKNIETILNGKKYIQYLNKFLIIIPEDYEMQASLWRDFYTYYGNMYEELIDIKMNLHCIDTLYNHIKDNYAVSPSTSILDYGCGSGLSSRIILDCKLIGYEPNDIMRMQSTRKGLETLNYQQFCSLPNRCFDYVISSYVFHMGLKERDIDLLISKVKNNGVIVANFYKDINRNYVSELYNRKGFSVNEVKGCCEGFGCVYEYRKKER